MISFVTILGFVLSALIFINRNERYGPNFFLALFIFFNSFYALTSYGFVSNEYRWLITKVYPFSILPNMSAGPFMFLYFASVFRPNFQFKPIHFWHFLPAFLFFINGSDYLFWDSTQKAKLYQAFMTDSSTIFSVPTLLIPYYWHVLFRMTQTFIYLLVCIVLFCTNPLIDWTKF